ncbi:MAG TPA: tRNA lysidine(34) synthetase TilS [Candidatus Saccharimonadales bacterium]|nr:tRNA lysidine(34) synthetase TilS [Candidatus Saccharimonadales bacterium]
MEINLQPGRYVAAISGGVDSIVLLDLLSKSAGLEVVVAHFNHGIRPDSSKDEDFVRRIAKRYGLKFESGAGHLGPKTGEDAARQARYDFLEKIRRDHTAKAIITAHHQDDLIETAFLNILRGTGPRGLAAIMLNEKVERPLLGWPKSTIIDYAKQKELRWRDDPSNTDEAYLRNYLRHNVLPKLNALQKAEIIGNIQKIAGLEKTRSALMISLSQVVAPGNIIDRQAFINLPAELGGELVTYWLRQRGIGDFDKKTIARLNVALRTSKDGTKHDVKGRLNLTVGKKTAQFVTD